MAYHWKLVQLLNTAIHRVIKSKSFLSFFDFLYIYIIVMKYLVLQSNRSIQVSRVQYKSLYLWQVFMKCCFLLVKMELELDCSYSNIFLLSFCFQPCEVLEATKSTLKEIESRHTVIQQLWKKCKQVYTLLVLELSIIWGLQNLPTGLNCVSENKLFLRMKLYVPGITVLHWLIKFFLYI